MINLPSSLRTEIKKLYGVNPVIVIEVDWASDTGGIVTNRYSTQEFTNLTTYRYIKEYSDVEIVNHVQGLGQVNSISVTAIDDFGHFKGRLDSKNIFHLKQAARVYLGAAISATEISSLMLLFTGRMENIEWHEQGKEVTFEIVSESLDIIIGFTPNVEMIDPDDDDFKLFDGWLNTKTWPRVYGDVERFEAVPLVTVNNQIEVQGSDEYRTDGDGSDFANIDVNDEVGDFIDLDESGEYWVFAKDDILETTGSFTDIGDGDIVYQPTTITNRLWEPGSPVTVTKINPNVIEFAVPPPIPLKGMMMFMRFTFSFGSVQLPIRVRDTGFIEGKFRANLHLYMFFDDAVITILYAGKNLFTPTIINSSYRIMPKDQINFQRYIINTEEEEETIVNTVEVEDEDGVRIIPTSDYIVDNTENTGKFWDASDDFDEHPNVTYLQMNPETFFDYYEDFVAGGNVNEGLLVSMSSPINTEIKALTDIINLAGQTIDTSLIFENRTVSFVLEEEEDFLDIISDIAWQGAKALRHHGGVIQVIDLFALPNISKTIKDDEAILNSLVYSYSPIEDVFTKFKITLQTMDFQDELVEFTEVKNTDKYKESIFEVDFFIYSNRQAAQPVIDYWVNRLSEAYHQLEIRATIENLALEVWDLILIDLKDLNFQDDTETFLTNVLSGSSIAWNGEGTIKEITLDWENLEVIITLRFTAKVSTI